MLLLLLLFYLPLHFIKARAFKLLGIGDFIDLHGTVHATIGSILNVDGLWYEIHIGSFVLDLLWLLLLLRPGKYLIVWTTHWCDTVL